MKSKIFPSLSQGTSVKAIACPGREVLSTEPHPFHYPSWVRRWRFTASWGPLYLLLDLKEVSLPQGLCT